MPKNKRTKARRPRPDVNEIAHRVMLEATGQAPKTVRPRRDTDPCEERDDAATDAVKPGEDATN